MYLLQCKASAVTDVEASLVETTIGEYEEMGAGAGPSTFPPQVTTSPASVQQASGAISPAQRSLSDRYSYRAAIYQNDAVEYDMV